MIGGRRYFSVNSFHFSVRSLLTTALRHWVCVWRTLANKHAHFTRDAPFFTRDVDRDCKRRLRAGRGRNVVKVRTEVRRSFLESTGVARNEM